jgi:D-arginine dehydrogenase
LTTDSEFLIVGAGIAGASIGYWLAPRGKTVLLERESQPGYHSTGRSAAIIIDSYGSAQVRALTLASKPFFSQPPVGFSEAPLITPRPVMMVAKPTQQELLEEHFAVVRSVTALARRLTVRQACELVPVLRPEQLLGAVLDPAAADIDANALHQGFLRGIRKSGGHILCGQEVVAVERQGDRWIVSAGDSTYRCAVLINAAGAWCDRIARLAGVTPVGLVPKRRSAFLFAPPAGVAVDHWPMFGALDETWYIKPSAGLLFGSPANADPVEPHDVQADELDIALGIHHIEEMTTLQIRRPSSIWAGLRSFVADGDLVGGYDPAVPGFFWVAAQGGYGIQTAPAMSQCCAALVLGQEIPRGVADFGISESVLGPARLSTTSHL